LQLGYSVWEVYSIVNEQGKIVEEAWMEIISGSHFEEY
jgi:hypothetical protein